ncbi:LETM1-like protein-domain-containing protein [Syncephalastrum racemosum]|uniref:LETM1-like protein-domain-containing protein n=1 Tax=Syncephalastrum racemosum TaxID=13706 RepID=A0A1X2H654_SYNRA|nr:LETM1-like protein-domain-containing protein [Syncephalastrum racemosum]
MYPTTTTTAHIAVSFRTMCTGMPVRGVFRTSIARMPMSAAAHRRAWVTINTTPRRHLSMTKPRLAEEEHSTMTSRAARLAKEQKAKEQLQAQQEAAADSAAAAVKPKKKTLWQKVKAEAVHYWHGTQLLGLEIRISSKLTWKLLNGGHLTRREHRQLRRTTSDILRLVPFAVFILVPFMELLLPVALKLFPNMLPSTFESKSTEEEKKRKLLKVRLEMARFLQETIAESGFPGSDSSKAAKEFADFFRKIRMTGEQPTTDDLLKVARRFEDELTLDNLSRPQLVSMCKYMNINAFGTDNFLRFQIRNRMRQIKQDDKVIQAEGINSLSIQELQHACAARGMRTIGASPGRLRDELAQWVDLNLNHQVPPTLLILARAFSFTDRTVSTEEALRATFNSLPDNLVNETELQVLEMVGQSTYKHKLEVLEQQQELIEDESEQEEKEAEARRQSEEAEKQRLEEQKQELEATKRDAFVPDEEKPKKEERLSEEEHQELQDALAKLRTKVDVLEERAQLNEIKFHHQDYKELIEQLREATHKDADKASLRLGRKLEKMLNEIDSELDTLEKDQKDQKKKNDTTSSEKTNAAESSS